MKIAAKNKVCRLHRSLGRPAALSLGDEGNNGEPGQGGSAGGRGEVQRSALNGGENLMRSSVVGPLGFFSDTLKEDGFSLNGSFCNWSHSRMICSVAVDIFPPLFSHTHFPIGCGRKRCAMDTSG